MITDRTSIPSLAFLQGGGKMGELMRAHDWSASPLGPPDGWPQSLRSVVGLLLQSKFPMFVAWGKDLGFLYNDSYAEILGAKHPRALGIRFYDIWSEIWPDISPLIDAAMAGEATYRENLPLVMNRKGFDEQTWFTFSYSPVRDETGRVAGMYCACTETTPAIAERKILADIVEGTDAFVQVADLDYRWLAINRAAADEFERIFGVRPRVGLSMLDALAGQPDHQAAVKAVWSRAIGGESFVAIDEFGDPNRDRRYYEMRYDVLRDAQGKQIGAYQFVYDVTERLRDQARLAEAEAALRQAQKMEAVGQLTGGVAHDFNNLLMAISAGLRLLDRPLDAESRDRVAEGMRKAVDRGAALTRQLLAFSRLQPLDPRALELRTQLAAMRELLDRSLRADIQVVMDMPDGVWAIEADPGELELAVINICVNARDAMPNGGTITIATRNLSRASGAAGRDSIELAISDTGAGMPPEVVARAFEPFFTTKDVGKGSGLGLAQVYAFATRSNGAVGITSAPSAGTTVTLTFPRSEREPVTTGSEKPPRASLSAQRVRRGHVLLVEDDKEVATLTREMFASLGFSVTYAASAEAALGALKNERSIDIVFSDVMMPGGMNGVELAREIRRRKPHLPIILATGFVEAARDAEKDGIAVLAKPYELEELTNLIDLQLSETAGLR